MNIPINTAFKNAKNENRSALISYTVCGDHNKKTSLDIIKSISKNLDIVEWGIPHNCPTADGKDIQNVSDINPGSGNGYTGLYTNAEDMYLFMKAVFVDHSLISSNSLDTILDSFVMSSGGAYASSSGGIHQQDIHFFGDSLHAYGHSGGDIGYTANVIYIQELQAIVILNYNYGTQFSTPLGSELYNMKRALYSAVIVP